MVSQHLGRSAQPQGASGAESGHTAHRTLLSEQKETHWAECAILPLESLMVTTPPLTRCRHKVSQSLCLLIYMTTTGDSGNMSAFVINWYCSCLKAAFSVKCINMTSAMILTWIYSHKVNIPAYAWSEHHPELPQNSICKAPELAKFLGSTRFAERDCRKKVCSCTN